MGSSSFATKMHTRKNRRGEAAHDVMFGRMANHTTPRTVQVGLVQMRCGLDPEPNLKKAIAGIREAAAKGAQIICLQELFRSQYFCQIEDHGFFDLAEPIPGPSTETLSAVAREL